MTSMQLLLANILISNNIILKITSMMDILNISKDGSFSFYLRLIISWWIRDGANLLEAKLNLRIKFFKWKVKSLFVGKGICNLRKLREELVFSKCLRSLQDNRIKRKISLRFMKILKNMKVRTLSSAIAEKKI